ncbi:MAG: hypothetical protein ACREVG_11605 [Burkholderiales bacterium]
MQAESIAARLVAVTLLASAACVSFPLYGQTVMYAQPHWAAAAPPPWALGAASGAQFGAQVSAMNPAIRCRGGRSFTCGAHFDPRPVFAGALLGGVIAALSAPVYYDAPFAGAPEARWLQRDRSEPSPNSTGRAPSIADGWQQFGAPNARAYGSTDRTQFVEAWQRFFEPSQ